MNHVRSFFYSQGLKMKVNLYAFHIDEECFRLMRLNVPIYKVIHSQIYYMNSTDFARICGVSLRSVYRWMAHGHIETVKSGKTHLFALTNVKNFIATNTLSSGRPKKGR